MTTVRVVELDEQTVEEERLAALRELGLLDTPAEERFDRITRMATHLFGVRYAAINLVDADRQVTKSSSGLEMDTAPRSDSICSVAIQQDDAMVVPDARLDPRFEDNAFVIGDPNLRFYAGQPLVGPGGYKVGTLCLFDPEPRTLDGQEEGLLRDLGRWVQEEMAVDREMERAVAVQRGLWPRRTPSDGPWEVVGECLPARDVGGDLYDWYRARSGMVVTLGDVMGKGMPAAIMMATVRAVLRAGSRGGDLVAAVEGAAEAMDDDFADTGAFATVFHALLHDDGVTVEYVDAGHGLAVVVRADGSAERLAVTGPLVGPVIPGDWETRTVTLDAGAHLVVVSDGLLDRHPSVEDAVDAVVRVVRAAGSPQGVVDDLLAVGRIGRADDDETVLVVRRRT